MSDLVQHEDAPVEPAALRVLLYSDDRNVREQVRFAVGERSSGRLVQWTEVATHPMVFSHLDNSTFDLVVLDGEAAKSGGMGICRQIRNEYYHSPKALLLVGRQADAWLATWSEADAAVSHPLDPFQVKAAFDELTASLTPVS